MGRAGGCLKNGCLGCLGMFVLLAVFLAINAAIVANRGDEQIRDTVLESGSAPTDPIAPAAEFRGAGATRPAPGRGWLVLELGQGEFELGPGEPGAGVVVKARYDETMYELEQYSHTWPDSAWVYHVRFGRTVSGVQALMAQIMGDYEDPKLHVLVPPDLAVELNVLVSEGGLEAELDGLWLTEVDLRYDKGGISLSIDEPLREPLERFTVRGRMGGGDLSGLGNASPRVLDVSGTMGGMALDLSGEWRNSCDARIDITMGGIEVSVPRGMDIDRGDGTLEHGDAEVARPVLRVRTRAKMGEIEVR